MTVRDALDTFLARFEIARADYRAPRFVVTLGPLTIAFPNPGLLAHHDLHHVALAIPPTFWGEVEISAFELRSGPRTALITLLCFGALFFGILRGPRRVARAWRRYAGARNLYREEYETLLGMDLEDLRRWMRLPPISVGSSGVILR